MSDLFSGFFSQARKFWNTSSPNCFLDDCTSANGVSMPFLKLLLNPFRLFIDHLTPIMMLSGIYGLYLTVLALASGFSFICSFQRNYDVFYPCQFSLAAYGAYLLVRIFIISWFMVKWLNLINGAACTWKTIFKFPQNVGRTFGLLLINAATFLFPILSTSLLVQRVPNPDWRIEISYFAVVSIGYIIPFLAVKFYALIAFAAAGEPFPPLSDIWKRNSGNMLKTLISLFFILILMIFFIANLFSGMSMNNNINPVWFGFISELMYNIVMLWFAALFAANCQIQKNFLYGETKDE